VSGNRHFGDSALPHLVASTLPDQSPSLALRRGSALDPLLELTLLHPGLQSTRLAILPTRVANLPFLNTSEYMHPTGPERVLPSYNATPSVSHRHRNIARRGIWFERIDLFLTKDVLADQSPIGAPLRSNTEAIANKCAFQHTRVGRSRLCFVCNAAEL
jgi:hypothetical protein